MGARKVMVAKSIVPGQPDQLKDNQKLCLAKNSDDNNSKTSKARNEKGTSKVVPKVSSTGTGAQESPSSLKGKQEEPLKCQLEEEEVNTLIIDDSTFQESE